MESDLFIFGVGVSVLSPVLLSVGMLLWVGGRPTRRR